MSFLYDCWRVDETTCLVKLAEEEVTAEDHHDQDRDGIVQETRERLRKSWLIPKFSRTRTVTIRKDTALGVWVALCTCGTGERYDMCCRHIYRALDISPDKFHARFSYWKVYDLLSLGNDLPADLREKLVAAFKEYEKAVGIIVDCTHIPAHTHSSRLESFQCTLNHSDVRRVGYWGTNKGKEQIQKAMKILLPYKNNGGIRSFGVEQEGSSKQSTYFGLKPHSNYTTTDDVEENRNELEEDLAHRPALLTPSRPHIDLEVTSQMASDIKNRWNPQRITADNSFTQCTTRWLKRCTCQSFSARVMKRKK
jgi:hypothetical protein